MVGQVQSIGTRASLNRTYLLLLRTMKTVFWLYPIVLREYVKCHNNRLKVVAVL